MYRHSARSFSLCPCDCFFVNDMRECCVREWVVKRNENPIYSSYDTNKQSIPTLVLCERWSAVKTLSVRREYQINDENELINGGNKNIRNSVIFVLFVDQVRPKSSELAPYFHVSVDICAVETWNRIARTIGAYARDMKWKYSFIEIQRFLCDTDVCGFRKCMQKSMTVSTTVVTCTVQPIKLLAWVRRFMGNANK